MLYAILDKNKKIIEAPVTMRSQWGGIRAFHTLSEEKLKSHGWYPCVVVGEFYDSRKYRLIDVITEFDAVTEVVTVTYRTAEKSFETVVAEKKAALATRRYTVETAGIVVGEYVILTDTASQNRIIGAYSASQLLPDEIIDFKSANGWVKLDATAMHMIAESVGRHVQSCFSNERVHDEAIDLLTTIDEVISYDITIGWGS